MGRFAGSDPDKIIALMYKIRTIIADRVPITRSFIKHYTEEVDDLTWDFSLLPELCTLYSGYMELDGFLFKRMKKVERHPDKMPEILSEADMKYIASKTEVLRKLEDLLLKNNLCLYHI